MARRKMTLTELKKRQLEIAAEVEEMPPKPTEMPIAEPQVLMFLYIGGQNYGPYDYKTLKSFVPTGQLTPQTMVWQQGMAAWTPAGQVPELQALFAQLSLRLSCAVRRHS